MAYMPVGGGGGDREQPQPGAVRAYLHGIWYIGLHKKVWQGNEKRVHQGMAVFELDQIDTQGRRFLMHKRVTWSVHEKSVIRTQFGPVFKPECFAWSDNEWAEANIGILENERPEGYMRGPCMVNVVNKLDNGSACNAFIKAVALVTPGQDALVPQQNFDEKPPYLVDYCRGLIEGKESKSLLEPYADTIREFAEPKPIKQGAANKEAAELAAARADGDYPDESEFADQF